jgi:hypothetical protein
LTALEFERMNDLGGVTQSLRDFVRRPSLCMREVAEEVVAVAAVLGNWQSRTFRAYACRLRTASGKEYNFGHLHGR